MALPPGGVDGSRVAVETDKMEGAERERGAGAPRPPPGESLASEERVVRWCVCHAVHRVPGWCFCFLARRDQERFMSLREETRAGEGGSRSAGLVRPLPAYFYCILGHVFRPRVSPFNRFFIRDLIR